MIFCQNTKTRTTISHAQSAPNISAPKETEDKEVNENRPSVTVNIAHHGLPSVDVGDLLTIPVTVDPLPIDPFA